MTNFVINQLPKTVIYNASTLFQIINNTPSDLYKLLHLKHLHFSLTSKIFWHALCLINSDLRKVKDLKIRRL